MTSTKIKLNEKCREPELAIQIQRINNDVGEMLLPQVITANGKNEIPCFDKAANVKNPDISQRNRHLNQF